MGKNLPPPAPRRPAVVPIAAEAFVTGAPSTLKTPEPSNDSSELSALESQESPSVPNASVSRRDGRQVLRLVAYFDPTLAKSLERWCVDHEMDVSAGIVEA
jgi:hypothetical protein